MPTALDKPYFTSRNLGRAELVRSASGARAGSIKLRSGDLELDSALGPELSDSAPLAYHRSIVLHDPETTRARVTGELRVGISSDLQGPARDGLACAEVSLESIGIAVGPRLRLRASGISTHLVLSKSGMRIRGAVDVALRDAALEIEGLEPIALPQAPVANSSICPGRLESMGIRLTLNAQTFCGAGVHDRIASVVALRLSFARAVIEGIQHAGEIEIGIATTELGLELGRPASALVGWSPPRLRATAPGTHRRPIAA